MFCRDVDESAIQKLLSTVAEWMFGSETDKPLEIVKDDEGENEQRFKYLFQNFLNIKLFTSHYALYYYIGILHAIIHGEGTFKC